MIQLIIILAGGLYPVPVEKTEWYLICQEQIENYWKVPSFCKDYDVEVSQPKNYLNIKN